MYLDLLLLFWKLLKYALFKKFPLPVLISFYLSPDYFLKMLLNIVM